MDIEKIKKINELAHDLLRRGMASDRIEAAQMAEKMIDKGGAQPVVEEKDDAETKEVKTAQPDQSQAAPVNYKEIVKVLSDNAEFMMDALKEFHAKFAELRKEIGELRRKVSQGGHQERPQQSLKKYEKEPHPKQGRHTPEDVSVEKMFYYGNKK